MPSLSIPNLTATSLNVTMLSLSLGIKKLSWQKRNPILFFWTGWTRRLLKRKTKIVLLIPATKEQKIQCWSLPKRSLRSSHLVGQPIPALVNLWMYGKLHKVQARDCPLFAAKQIWTYLGKNNIIQRKGFYYISGRDKLFRPVIIFRVNAMDP
jgi:hypothetical protein